MNNIVILILWRNIQTFGSWFGIFQCTFARHWRIWVFPLTIFGNHPYISNVKLEVNRVLRSSNILAIKIAVWWILAQTMLQLIWLMAQRYSHIIYNINFHECWICIDTFLAISVSFNVGKLLLLPIMFGMHICTVVSLNAQFHSFKKECIGCRHTDIEPVDCNIKLCICICILPSILKSPFFLKGFRAWNRKKAWVYSYYAKKLQFLT